MSVDKPKRTKPYEREDKTKDPEVIQRSSSLSPNCAYVEIPTPTILRRKVPVGPMKPMIEDVPMEENVTSLPKGKSREEGGKKESNRKMGEKLESVKTPKVRFEVKERDIPRVESTPSFKYAMEIQNQTSAKEVFQKMLAQLVTLTLGEVLGSSFELGKRFLKANQSHHLLVQKSSNVMAEYESEEEVPMSR